MATSNGTCRESAVASLQFSNSSIIMVGNTLIALPFHAFIRLVASQALLVVWPRALYWAGAMFNIFARFDTGSGQSCASSGVLCLQGALADALDTVKVVPTTFGLPCSSGTRASS